MYTFVHYVIQYPDIPKCAQNSNIQGQSLVIRIINKSINITLFIQFQHKFTGFVCVYKYKTLQNHVFYDSIDAQFTRNHPNLDDFGTEYPYLGTPKYHVLSIFTDKTGDIWYNIMLKQQIYTHLRTSRDCRNMFMQYYVLYGYHSSIKYYKILVFHGIDTCIPYYTQQIQVPKYRVSGTYNAHVVHNSEYG